MRGNAAVFSSEFPSNSEPRAADHAATIRQPEPVFEQRRHRIELAGVEKVDPEPEVRTEDATQLLGAEPRDRFGDSELPSDSGEIGAGGQPEEANRKAELGGEVERRADRVAAVEQRLERTGEPLEGG